jgi:DNA-directed RNA polymerase subunit RPC12/RpoP
MWVCNDCGRQWSAVMGDNEVPEKCPDCGSDVIEMVMCAYCNEPIEPGDEEATPQGSMHGECAHKHEEENPEEW